MSGKQEETSGIAQLGCAEHSCLIYRTAAEQIDALVPWLRSGIEQSERCIYIADANNIAVLREILGTHGVVVDLALEAGVSLLDEDSHPFIRRMRFDMDAYSLILTIYLLKPDYAVVRPFDSQGK